MRRLFAEGPFTQAFVPILSDYQKNKTKEEMESFLNSMAGALWVTGMRPHHLLISQTA